jgi:transcriptional regulator with XRE-family HTH domain
MRFSCPQIVGPLTLAALRSAVAPWTKIVGTTGDLMPRGTLDPTDKHVGSRMRMRRLILDMSQTDVADALGLTFQQVQKYEQGTNRIGAGRLQHISQILQVPVPFLPAALGAGPSTADRSEALSASPVTDFLATSDGLHAYRKLPAAPR